MAQLKDRVSLDGLEGVLEVFTTLKSSMQKKHLKKAQNETAKALLWAARGRTPRRSGLLYKSMGRKVKVYPSGVVVAVVGARKGFRKEVGTRVRGKKTGSPIFADPTKYLHLVELGTQKTTAVGMLAAALSSERSAIQSRLVDATNNAVAEAATKGKK